MRLKCGDQSGPVRLTKWLMNHTADVTERLKNHKNNTVYILYVLSTKIKQFTYTHTHKVHTNIKRERKCTHKVQSENNKEIMQCRWHKKTKFTKLKCMELEP